MIFDLYKLICVRFYFGGSDDGGDGGAELRRQEEERQARIKEGTSAINEIFGGKTYKKTANPARIPRVTTPAPSYNINERGTPVSSDYSGNRGSPNQPSPTTWVDPTAPAHIFEESGVAPGQFGDDYFSGMEKDYLDYYMPQFDRQAKDADRSLRIGLAKTGNIGSTYGAGKIADLAGDKESQRRRIVEESMKYSSGQRKSLEDTRGNLLGQLEAGAGVENVAGQAAAQARSMTAPPAFSPLADLFKNYTAAVANASVARGDPNYPGAEDQRRSLLFNIPSSGSSGSATYRN